MQSPTQAFGASAYGEPHGRPTRAMLIGYASTPLQTPNGKDKGRKKGDKERTHEARVKMGVTVPNIIRSIDEVVS